VGWARVFLISFFICSSCLLLGAANKRHDDMSDPNNTKVASMSWSTMRAALVGPAQSAAIRAPFSRAGLIYFYQVRSHFLVAISNISFFVNKHFFFGYFFPNFTKRLYPFPHAKMTVLHCNTIFYAKS
jgi:hypothetical protein